MIASSITTERSLPVVTAMDTYRLQLSKAMANKSTLRLSKLMKVLHGKLPGHIQSTNQSLLLVAMTTKLRFGSATKLVTGKELFTKKN